ncbi:MAG: hypothetical protein ACE5NA_09490 [Nitrospiraceae bacterium]
MKRWIIIGGVVMVAIVALVVYTVFTSLDSIIKGAIEKYGTEITQTTVRLNRVKISLTDGEGALRGLSVGNPKGFETDRSFQLGEIKVALDIGTITADPVVIKEILIDKPIVTYELGPKGSNLDAIQRNVQAYMGPGGDGSKADAGEGPKLVVENLYLKGGKVNVKATVLKGQELSATLPDIHIKDIGKGNAGASPGEVVEQIMAYITPRVGSAVAKLNVDKLQRASEEEVQRATKKLEEGDVQGATEAAKETGEKLKSLFK